MDATNNGAVSKLVKAWEAKNGERAKRVAGLGLMAVSLAACGGEDDDVVAAFNAATTAYNTAATAATTAATAAAAAQAAADALEDAAGDLTAAEAYEDAASAALTAAQAAQTAAAAAAAKAALLVTAAAATESTTDDSVGTAATVATAALTAAATNMVTAATAEVASAASAVALFSTPVAVALTALQDIADDLTAGNDTVTAIVSTGLTTISETDFVIDDSSVDNDTLTVTSNGDSFNLGTVVGIENIIVNVTDFTAGGIITATNVASGTLTINNLQIAGTTEAEVVGAGGITVAAGSGVTGTIDVTMSAGASTVVNSGAAANVIVTAAVAANTITVVAAGDIDLTSEVANTLRVSGTGDVTLNTHSTGLVGLTGSITGTAGQNLIVAGVGAATVAGTAISGFDSVTFDTLGGAFDATRVTSAIVLEGATNDLTVANNASITSTDAGALTLTAVNDATVAVVTQTANVTLGAAHTGITTAVSGTADVINVVNVTAGVAQTNLTLSSTTATTFNLSGSVNATIIGDATAGDVLNASALTGNLTVVATAGLLSITGGAGDDAITARTAVAFALEGGSGTDTLTLAADMSAGTFSGFEILTGTGDFLSTQLSGLTAVVATGAAITIGAGDVHGNTINLSGLTFAGAAGVNMTASTQDTSFILAGSAMNITGSNAGDILIGFAGADVISGGEGIDGIAGGAGADTINLTELVAAVDTVVFGNTQTTTAGADIAFGALLGADTITGFSAGVVDDVLTFDISAFGLAAVTEFVGAIGTLAVDASDNLVVLTGVGYASDEAAEDAIAARVTTNGSDMVFGYFNTTTGLTHFVHDTDSGVDGTATTTLIATLSGFTSQALHDTLDANNVASFA